MLQKLFLAVIVLLVCQTQKVSADPWTVPADKSLELSLISLRDTAMNVQERNKWLVNEMDRLNQLISSMDADLKILEESSPLEIEEQDVIIDKEVDNLSLHEKQLLRQQMSLSQLQSELSRLKAELQLKSKQEGVFRNSIQALQSEIKTLKGGKSSESSQVTPQSLELSRYKRLVEESRQKIAKAEKEYVQSKKKFEKPSEILDRQKRQNEDLQSKLEILQDELKIAFEEESILNKEILETQSKKQAQLASIQEQIAALQKRQNELNAVLLQARAKLKGQNIQLSDHQDSVVAMEGNLGVMKKEKIVLQNQISSLESTLDHLQSR